MTGQEIFELILNSNIINFTIMVSVLVWIYKHFQLNKIFDSITDDIKNNVTSSAGAVKNAIDEYKKIRGEKRRISEKKEVIIQNAKSIVGKLNQKNLEEIQTKEKELELNKTKTKEVLIGRIKEKTANDIKEAVYKLSQDVIKENMNDEIQFNSIKNALDELDKIGEVKF